MYLFCGERQALTYRYVSATALNTFPYKKLVGVLPK